ncbi:unnamed protein product [Periconia digitata]|uniref:BRCT domain-containing protein n=1 Tax=Periconia digitata TaxID=1303443 RepID=A0A9W4UGG8_9PLEO|nr:unnamed protein product [Periconia digitata]
MVATRRSGRKAPEVEAAASTLNAPPKRATKRKAAEEAPVDTTTTRATKASKASKAEPKTKKPAAKSAASKPAAKVAVSTTTTTRTTRTRRAPQPSDQEQEQQIEEPQVQPSEPEPELEAEQEKSVTTTAKRAVRGRKPAAKEIEPAPVPTEPPQKATRGRKAQEPALLTVPEVDAKAPATQKLPAKTTTTTRSTRARATTTVTKAAESTSTLRAPARKPATRKPRATAKATNKVEATPEPVPVVEEPLTEFPNWPNTPAHIKAPISNQDAIEALPKQFPSTPHPFLEAYHNRTAIETLPNQYPGTPHEFVDAYGNKKAMENLPEAFPDTPHHVLNAYSNQQALNTLPDYPKTPNHVLNAFSNQQALDALPNYPKTPSDFLEAQDNRNALDTLPKAFPETPAHVLDAYSNQQALDTLPSYPKTPSAFLEAHDNRQALDILPRAFPETPIHVLDAYSNQQAMDTLPGYPKTPSAFLEAHSNKQSIRDSSASARNLSSPHKESIQTAQGSPKMPSEIETFSQGRFSSPKTLSDAESTVREALSSPKLPSENGAVIHEAPCSPKISSKIEAITQGASSSPRILSDIESAIQEALSSRPHTPDMGDTSFENLQTSVNKWSDALKEREQACKTPDAELAVESQDSNIPVTSGIVLSAISFAPSLPVPMPVSPTKSALRSPLKAVSKTPKKVVTWQEECEGNASNEEEPLQGMIFFVDVMSNGRDQSFLFTTLLEDLGAKVLREYNEHTYLTHVLWKDGNMSTLELVAGSHGKVKCVNVGWVLDSEKNKKRMDEDPYIVDLSWFTEPKPQPFTPARTPAHFLAAVQEKSSSIKAIPSTPTSSEFDRSINFDDDKENSELGIYFQDYAKTAPRPKATWLMNKSPLKTPSKQNFLYQQPIKALSTAKKRSAGESFGAFASVPPKKLRFV